MKYELINIGHDDYLVFSRGHHNIDEFTKYVKQEYSEWGNFFDIAYHHYYRKIGNQYGTWYEPCLPFTRGAFPVTVAQEGWKDQRFFIANKISEGKHVKSIGNYHIVNHYYMKGKYELWYASDNTSPTELRIFDTVEYAENFVECLLIKGEN